MNNENCVIMTDQYKRIQGAKLKTQNKNFSVYKGVNTVGRNKTAIINLKNLNVSQHHAVIIIVDDTQHFISDLNSSNGTYLLGTKLSPYKLYELPDNVDIKFGDIAASYFKVSNMDTTVHLEMESMEMTQNMTQNFYGAATQLLINESSLNQTRPHRTSHALKGDFEDIHEAATQLATYPSIITDKLNQNSQEDTHFSIEILDNDIHEAPTQVVDYHQASTSKVVSYMSEVDTQSELSQKTKKKEQLEMDIHEMPTQVVYFPQELKTNESETAAKSSDSSTQINEDIRKLKNSSQSSKQSNEHTKFNESSAQIQKESNVSTIIEETVIEETVMEDTEVRDDDENSNNSVDFLTMHKDLGNEHVSCNESLISINDKDSTVSDSQDIGIPRKRPVLKLSSSEDLSQSQDRKITYNFDSDTDVEDEIKINVQSEKKNSNLSKKRQTLGSDSDTEIEDDLPERSKNEIKNCNSDSETDIEDDICQTTQSQTVIKPKILTKKKIIDSDSETDIEDNIHQRDSETQSQGIIKPKILTKKRTVDSDSETDIEDNKEKESELQATRDENNTEILNDTDCIPATQDAFADIFMYKDSKTVRSNINSQNVSSEESFKLGLTELMVESIENKMPDDIHEKDLPEDVENKENNIDSMKAVENTNNHILNNEITDKCINLNKEKNDIASNINKNEADDLFSSNILRHRDCSNKKINTNIPSISNVDIQKINEKVENNRGVNSSKNSNIDEETDDLYMMATQKICTDMRKDRECSLKLNADAPLVSNIGNTVEASIKNNSYEISTQKLNENAEGLASSKEPNIQKEPDDDFYMIPTQNLNVSSSKQTNIQKESDDDFYMMPTQNLNENETEPQFKTPQKKFNFRKKEIKLDASLSSILSNNPEDPYSAASQQINDVSDKNDDIYLQATQKLNEEPKKPDVYLQPTQDLNVKSNTLGENEDDFYMVPTQRINSSVQNEKANKVLSKQDLQYLQETQDLHLTKNLEANNVEIEEDLYIVPTQHINMDLGKDIKMPLNENLKATTSLETPEKTDDDNYYMASTQPINLNLASEEIDKVPLKTSITDMYLQETQDLGLTKNLEANKNKNYETYLVAKQPSISEDVVQDNFVAPNPPEGALTKASLDGSISGTKRQGTSHATTFSEPKKIKNEPNPEVETLSQIEAFIKQPLKKVKRATKLDEASGQISKKKIEETEVDQSETLSQIERFVKQPFVNTKKSKIKTLPKKRLRSSCTPSFHPVTLAEPDVPTETLSQIQAFIEKPLSTSKDKNATISKCNREQRQIVDIAEEKADNEFQKPEETRTICRTTISETISTRHSKSASNEKYETDNNSILNRTSDKSMDIHKEQDFVKTDVEKSFALLEAKSTKTRKSQRLTSAAEIKVAVCKNRRSMTTSAIPECSSDFCEMKPLTRKSRKKSTNINNNNVANVSNNSDIKINMGNSEGTVIAEADSKITVRSKRKFELAQIKETDSDISKSETPCKMQKMNATKKGKQKNAMDISNVFSFPSTSKVKVSAKQDYMKGSDSRSFYDDSSNSNDSASSTPSRRGRRNIQTETLSSSPEKAKRRQKPKVVFTMLDSPLLESLIRQMGGSVVDSVESSTVLVTEHVKRSQKLLTAIGQGKPICSPEWIHASKKANEFLDPWDYILLDKEAESKWNFSLKESITRSNKEKLLSNYTFQLMVNNAADVLKGAIEACGGKCVPRHPAKNAEGFFVVVASPENRSKYLKIKKQHLQVTVVEPEAIFDGVLRQELRLGRHLLT